jgi:hypothetical protein
MISYNYHNTHNQHNEYNEHKYPVSLSRVFEWYIPENVIDQMNDVLVQDIFSLDEFICGRAIGTHNKSDLDTARLPQQASKQTCPIQLP